MGLWKILLGCFYTINFFLINAEIIEMDYVHRTRNLTIHSINKNYNNKNSILEDIVKEELPLVHSERSEMIVTISLGTPPQYFNVLVDTGSYMLWVTDSSSTSIPVGKKKFITNDSTSFYKTTTTTHIQYGTGSVDGTYCTETVGLGQSKMNGFSFVLVNKEESNDGLDGILGLGYDYIEEEAQPIKFSLLDQLASSKVIKSKIFTQKTLSRTTGKMYFGELPKEITSDYKNYGNCTVLKENPIGQVNSEWVCTMRGVYFGYDNINSTQILDEPALFDSGTNIMIAPSDWLNALKDTYFKELAASGDCEVKIRNEKFLSWVCKQTLSIDKLKDVNFIFGKWVLKLQIHELFQIDEDESLVFIIRSSIGAFSKQWIIGQPILTKFHMVYDKENNVIGFYGTEDKFDSTLPFPNPYIKIYIVLIVFGSIIFIALIVWLIWFILKKRRARLTYYQPSMYNQI